MAENCDCSEFIEQARLNDYETIQVSPEWYISLRSPVPLFAIA
jgi:hypothetical protein